MANGATGTIRQVAPAGPQPPPAGPQPPPASATTLGRRPAALAPRLLALIAPAVPLVTTVVIQISRGWRPTSDDAAIAWRAFDVFSSHAPLLGAYNDATVSSAHPVFDLGPLQYYLLAIPTRIDPVHGILWGSALVAGLLAAISVESAWRAGGPPVGMAVSAGFVVMAATETRVVLNIAWNPNLGLYAFAATLVLSAVATSGRTAWWPAAVVSGCLAAECHLIFGAAAVLAVATGVVFGSFAGRRLASRGRPLLHAAIGALLGLACLLPALVQQIADNPGNLSALFDNLTRARRTLGIATGLRAIGRASLVPPLWARPAPPLSGHSWYAHFVAAILTGSAPAGVLVVLAVAGVAIWATVRGWRGLAAVASVAALSALGLAWTIGGIAVDQKTIITYADVALWPVGMMLDATVVACVLTALTRLARGSVATIGWESLKTRPVALAGTLPLALLLAWSLWSSVPLTSNAGAIIGGWSVAKATGPLAEQVERTHPSGVVVVEPSVPLLPSGLMTWSLVEAVAYQLKLDGARSAMLAPMAPEFGSDASPAREASAYLIAPVAGHRWQLRRVLHTRRLSILGGGGR